MANVTVSIDPDVLRRARVRATQEGTSVNAIIAEVLGRYADVDEAAIALVEILEMAAAADSGSGPDGRRWTREDLHDRAGLR